MFVCVCVRIWHLVLHELGVGSVDLHLFDLLLPLLAAQSSVGLEHVHLLLQLSQAALQWADLRILAGHQHAHVKRKDQVCFTVPRPKHYEKMKYIYLVPDRWAELEMQPKKVDMKGHINEIEEVRNRTYMTLEAGKANTELLT